MRITTRCLLFAAVALVPAPALASAATSATRGVVVQRDASAGTVVLATHSGALQRIRMARPSRLALGTLVSVRGTKVTVVGHARRAKLRGVVLRRSRHSFALASNGSVLAVSSVTPPASGQAITTTVQVGANELSNDDGSCHVQNDQAPSAELRGTVLSQDATTLRLTVPGFPAGVAIALGAQVIPALAAGTAVEAEVALAPDPANPDGIVLTLVSLRVDDGRHGHDGSQLKAEGQVTAITEAGAAAGSITIAGEHGSVTFVIPVGFGATGVAVGDTVEAKGTPGATPVDPPTLVRLESTQGDQGGQGDQGDQGDQGSNDAGSQSDGSGGND